MEKSAGDSCACELIVHILPANRGIIQHPERPSPPLILSERVGVILETIRKIPNLIVLGKPSADRPRERRKPALWLGKGGHFVPPLHPSGAGVFPTPCTPGGELRSTKGSALGTHARRVWEGRAGRR